MTDVRDALARKAHLATLGIFREHRGRDLVIPPDLDDPTPAPAPEVPPVDVLDGRIRRRVWPWFVGGTVVAALVLYGIWHHEQAMDRAEREHQYPVAASAADQQVIAGALARWQPGPVIAGITSPPELATLHLGAACDLPFERSLQFRRGDEAEARQQIGWLFETAKRGRFYDELERERTVAQVGAPILVISIADQELPEMTGSGSDLAYYAGHRTGTAYLFDVSGTVRCAGAFDAESSEVVKYRTITSDSPVLNGDRKVDATRAVAYDLDTNMQKAIAAGLHRVE